MDGDLQDEPQRDPALSRRSSSEGSRPRLRLEEERATTRSPSATPRKLFNWVTRQAGAGRSARLQLRLQGLPPRGPRADRALRRAASLHPGARQPPGLHASASWPSTHHPAPPGRQQVRLGSLLQGPARPDHRALHHQVHPPAAASLRCHRSDLLRSSASRSTSTWLVLWALGEPVSSNRPLLLLGVLLDAARDPGPDDRADRRDDHLQELPSDATPTPSKSASR